ncbi:related to ERJ5 Endoplasmic Reticulum located J-protein [Ramularia collo-cygni]|uniref:Related to ERJ5 Endoplasmic Reticulum located J-protein n=1 Tax=Ramularia collo-cygni TaxID=112498 RepID=A0A2D3V088_9PEZI|nr:related to ERJ5 Endoplasmic Reticulum located J-protein [Ramularia collo-cygni]CZT18087.1 related to ERJ5 Endoplasmic Reticulum located J-protein [Ramularia collo-cygni]
MRLLYLAATFAALAAAWSKEDHEIFRLRDEVQKSEGPNSTFYTFLQIPPSASPPEINAAYRKLSRSLHPDKARSAFIANYNKPPAVKGEKVVVKKNKKPSESELKKFGKEATARFERLSLVTNVLRGPERARYDHFLRNGFPAWRGTGYYYERFRPGLGSVMIGLFIFVGGAVHYAALFLSWKRHREFVARYIKHARRMAWGEDSAVGNIPGLDDAAAAPTSASGSDAQQESMQWNRKQKREMERQKKKDGKNPVKAAKMAAAAEKAKSEGASTPVEPDSPTLGPVGAKKRTVAENGKVLIVDSVGNVFLEQETEEGGRQEFLLDPEEVPRPTIYDTVLVRLPLFIWNRSLGQLLGKQTSDHVVSELVGDDEEGGEESLQAAVSANANEEARKRKGRK